MAKLFDLAKSAAKKTVAAVAAVRNILQRRNSLPKSGPPAPPLVAPPIVPRQPPASPRSGPPVPPGPLIAPPIVPRPSATPPGSPTRNPVPPAATPRDAIQPTSQEVRDIQEVQEVYTEVQLYGRDRGYTDEMQSVMAAMRRVGSSNVYGYFFELEKPGSGLLYVTFLGQTAGGKRSSAPGSTYAYFDVPTTKFEEFQRASDSSAGGAVWDYLRVRGSMWEHQHRYRLVQTAGDYVPRKATKGGFKTRQLAQAGQPKIPNSTWSAISRLEKSKDAKIRVYAGRMKQLLLQSNGFRRSTLAPRSFISNGGKPNTGSPNRGRPNRG